MESSQADKERRGREIQEAIRQVLLNVWDPIGIGDEPQAATEYDGYVGGVYRLLASQADLHAIATHLADLQTIQMGLPQTPEYLIHVAKRLKAIDVRLNP